MPGASSDQRRRSERLVREGSRRRPGYLQAAEGFLVVVAGDVAAADFVRVFFGAQAGLALGPGFEEVDGVAGQAADGVVVALAEDQ